MYRFHQRPQVPGWVPVRGLLVGALALLIGSTGVLLWHLCLKRGLLEEELHRSAAPNLRELQGYVDQDFYLIGIVALLSVASASALLLTWQWYRHASQGLSRLREYASDILDSLTTGVLTIDPSGAVTAMNERAVRMLGLSPREGLPCREVLHDHPALASRVDRLLAEGREFVDFEFTAGERTLRVDGGFLADRAGTVIQVADVTRWKEMEEETRRAEKLASLGTLAAGVAHEVRNPLSAIDINLQLLEESVTGKAQKERAARYFEVVKKEIHRLNGIIEDFIRFARPRPLERRRMRLDEVLDALLVLVRPECEAKGIAVVRQTQAAIEIDLDPEQIQQALLNLVLNALQSMTAGGTLTVGAEARGAQAVVRVADTGTGIPDEGRARLFDLFYSTKENGTGLGLPIAQSIVAGHGGSIRFDTGPSGTTFWVALPLAEAHAGTVVQAAAGR